MYINTLPILGANLIPFPHPSVASPVATPDIISTMPPGRSTRRSSAAKRCTELGPWGGAYGNSMETWLKPIEPPWKPIETYGNPVETQSKALETHGNPMEALWKPTETLWKPMEACIWV